MSVRRITFETWKLGSKSQMAAQGEFARLAGGTESIDVDASSVRFFDDVVYACEESGSRFIANVQKVWRVPVGIKVFPIMDELKQLDAEIEMLENRIGSISDGKDAHIALCNWFLNLQRHQDELMALKGKRKELAECDSWHWLVGSWCKAAA